MTKKEGSRRAERPNQASKQEDPAGGIQDKYDVCFQLSSGGLILLKRANDCKYISAPNVDK